MHGKLINLELMHENQKNANRNINKIISNMDFNNIFDQFQPDCKQGVHVS